MHASTPPRGMTRARSITQRQSGVGTGMAVFIGLIVLLFGLDLLMG